MKDSTIFQEFMPISLHEVNSVKLMNRIDQKYLIGHKVLSLIMNEISSDYLLLEIEKKRIMPYVSLYYDTPDNSMYLAHHNGKLNRYKIRFRKYLTNNKAFLEVKYKYKGIRTIKKRIEVKEIEQEISGKPAEYLLKTSPFLPGDLEPKIYTNFSRITLVNKNLTERVTIDLDLFFYFQNSRKFQLKNSAIIEVKRDGASGYSLLIETLRKYGVYSTGMSKYCMGRAIIEDGIKSNRFKEKILTLNKIENGKNYYRNLSFVEC